MIKLTGTLGVLLLAKENGLITSLSPLVTDLRKNGFYCSKKLIDDMLRIANESP
jgi:predicted nucleic acid-binding protein